MTKEVLFDCNPGSGEKFVKPASTPTPGVMLVDMISSGSGDCTRSPTSVILVSSTLAEPELVAMGALSAK
jgi:hypothetical protein